MADEDPTSITIPYEYIHAHSHTPFASVSVAKMNRMSPSYALGLLFILLVSIIWALASVLVQWMYTEKSFDSPFLLTYIGVSLFTLLLPNHFLSELCQGRTPILLLSLSPSRRHEQRSGAYETISIEATEASPPSSSESQSRTVSSWTVEDHCWAAAKIAPVWFVSNWSYNSSLKYTSITSSTVLSSTGSLFTFLFAVVLRDESFTMLKLSGVLLGMSGSILTAFHDIDARQDDNEPEQEDLSDTLLTHTGDENYKTLGDSLGLLSAVGYGAYTVMVRVLLPRQEHMFSMQVFLGFVGLFNCLALSPIMIWEVYHSSDLSLAVFSFVCLKGLLDNVLSDYLWARAVLLTRYVCSMVCCTEMLYRTIHTIPQLHEHGRKP